MGIEVLFWIWVLTWMTKTAATDVLHAVKGTPNPRYELKKQRAAAAGRPVKGQPRYATREWAADLYSDALAAHTEKRRKAAKAKGQPVDDMVDVVREKPVRAAKPDPVPAFRYETPEPPVPVTPQREETPEQANPARKTSDDGQVPAPPRRGLSDECEDCGEPCTGRFCDPCRQTLDVYKERARGLDAQRAARWARPATSPPSVPGIAPVIPMFPNPKQIEKEITMATSEVTGLSTAIAFAEAAASAHNSFASGGSEGYTGALAQHGVGEGCIGSAQEAQEASGVAAAKWAKHKADLDAQMNVKEAYQGTPDAGNREFLLNG